MKLKYLTAIFTAALAVSACSKDEDMTIPQAGKPAGVEFSLVQEDFYGDTRSGAEEACTYDAVEFIVADSDGDRVSSVKGMYEPSSSSFFIEGLTPGEYRIAILGIKGDYGSDGLTVHSPDNISERWISFPDDIGKPLEAEYFYSLTPFTVSGTSVQAPERITQKRIIGKIEFGYSYRNDYIRTAVLSSTATLESPRFHTSFSADGLFSGESSGRSVTLDMTRGESYLFLPSAGRTAVKGQAEMLTRDYRGGNIRRRYAFILEEILPNHIGTVHIDAIHPDDETGTMFITEQRYAEGDHGLILQDDEPASVYTDKKERNFNTASPLQLSFTPEGNLHARFYSPRELSGVLVRALVPSVCDEYFDLAYFDRIPAFADFTGTAAPTIRSGLYRTESGRIVRITEPGQDALAGAEFKVISDDPYWGKLQKIIHGWNIRFDLYGGDPTKPDGGPAGNWMGIRPVHCREAVALFLNFTYMIDMPEHERILKENEDRLYGNGGTEDKVTAETVLKQMRQERTINVGLVYTGNNVMGLGGGSTFGAWQGGWTDHYTSTYACEVMFHELGHVMGYNHSSSFTYGPWAQELMNNFYISHLAEMPVDSPDYLNSSRNPNLYK